MAPAAPLDQAMMVLRILHGSFLLSQGMFVLLLAVIRPQERDPGAGFLVPFAAIAFLNVALALFWAKGRVVAEAEERLRLQPQDPAARTEWMRGYIIAWALCESAGLFGLVLRFLGVVWVSAGPFFVLALIALVLCAPRRP